MTSTGRPPPSSTASSRIWPRGADAAASGWLWLNPRLIPGESRSPDGKLGPGFRRGTSNSRGAAATVQSLRAKGAGTDLAVRPTQLRIDAAGIAPVILGVAFDRVGALD